MYHSRFGAGLYQKYHLPIRLGCRTKQSELMHHRGAVAIIALYRRPRCHLCVRDYSDSRGCGTCTVVAQSGTNPYAVSKLHLHRHRRRHPNNETTCTVVAQSGSSPYSGPARSCTFNAAATSTTTVTSCTAVTPANAATPKHTCTYTGAATTRQHPQTACTVAGAIGRQSVCRTGLKLYLQCGGGQHDRCDELHSGDAGQRGDAQNTPAPTPAPRRH